MKQETNHRYRLCNETPNEKAMFLAIATIGKALGIDTVLYVDTNDNEQRLICRVDGSYMLGYDKYVWCYFGTYEAAVETNVLTQIKESIIDYYINSRKMEFEDEDMKNIFKDEVMEKAYELLTNMTKEQFCEMFETMEKTE